MKRKLSFMVVLALVLTMMMQMTVSAANGTITLSHCFIAGNQVNVIATGPVVQSDSGEYYLFALQPYETGVGNRTDFCASAPASETVQFATALNYNTASSKLYCRFVVTAFRGGAFVPISNEMYITNPEALATKSLGQPARTKKGLISDVRYASDLTDLNCGYATYILYISDFFKSGGVNYTYNGKTYSFNASAVQGYDLTVQALSNQGCNVVMVLLNRYENSAIDLLPPGARIPGEYAYGFNVQEQIPTEKLEAFVSFLANRYSGTGKGTIHSWVVGNEVNNNHPAHFSGNMTADQFAADYAKQFRVIYNAIKSVNKDALVYTNIDQRWNWEDGTPNQYAAKSFLDKFAANIKATGDVNWGLSFHPHAVPMTNCRFWQLPALYSGLRLIDSTDNSKMASIQNMEVFINHMKQPALLAADGSVRPIIITELGFTSSSPEYATDETTQAAALVYAYKKAMSFPEIDAFIIHKHVDDPGELQSGLAYGIRDLSGRKKFVYDIFKNVDSGNPAYTDFALPIIGVSSWSQLGLK